MFAWLALHILQILPCVRICFCAELRLLQAPIKLEIDVEKRLLWVSCLDLFSWSLKTIDSFSQRRKDLRSDGVSVSHDLGSPHASYQPVC